MSEQCRAGEGSRSLLRIQLRQGLSLCPPQHLGRGEGHEGHRGEGHKERRFTSWLGNLPKAQTSSLPKKLVTALEINLFSTDQISL